MTFHDVEYIQRVLWWAPHPGRGSPARRASAGVVARVFPRPGFRGIGCVDGPLAAQLPYQSVKFSH